jgi:hypothetical protein
MNTSTDGPNGRRILVFTRIVLAVVVLRGRRSAMGAEPGPGPRRRSWE